MSVALAAALVGAGGLAIIPAAHAQQQAAKSYSIPAGSLQEALDALAAQSDIDIVYPSDLVRGKRVGGISGQHGWRDVLQKLLENSGLVWEPVTDKTVVVKRPGGNAGAVAPRAGQSRPLERAGSSAGEDSIVGMPAIMVKGARTLNMDIERTADDPQPYVIFDRLAIERSGAVNLNDFLMTRLPMNASTKPPILADNLNGSVSSVNLRGLGESQTLILIDGRRTANSSNGNFIGQADINGIPMEAIERIEVLPSTASAIYGGSATGGVINIIMRRDYMGTSVAATYDNSFDTDSAVKRIDVSSGFSLFGGRTSVLLSGSYSESNNLLARDRDLVQRGRQSLLANNPGAIQPGSTPPLGPAANLRSVSGADLVMKDGTPLGASYTSVPVGYGGIGSDGGAALLQNAGRYNLGLGNSNNSSIGGGGSDLTSTPRTKYFSGSIRHEFSDSLSGFMEASRSENNSRTRNSAVIISTLPAGAPTNPFQQDVRVTTLSQQDNGVIVNDSKYDRLGAGLIFKLPGNWMGSADYTLTKSERSFVSQYPFKNAASFNAAVQDGSIDILADLDGQDLSPYYLSDISDVLLPLGVTTRNPALRLSGPVGTLKAGRPQISLLLERQDSQYDAATSYRSGFTLHRLFPERSQKVDSAYLELSVPLLSGSNSLAWAKELELQVAGRWDKYQNVNADRIDYTPPALPVPFTVVRNQVEKFSPLVAVRFRPVDSLVLRTSYSEGFQPPNLNQLTAPTELQDYNAAFVDPRRGYTSPVSTIGLTYGGNPDLEPETSTTWSGGIIFTPGWLEGLRVSLDFSRIEKEGNIATLTLQQVLDNENYFSDRVVRGVNLPGDPAGWAGPVTAIDYSYINAARTELETYDMQLDYVLHTAGKGSFSIFAVATWVTQYDVQLVASLPAVDSLGWVMSRDTASLDFKGNMGVTWALDPWTVGWSMRYTSSYYVADPESVSSATALLNQGNGGRVPSQVYHDVFAKYRFGSRSDYASWLGGLELQLGVRNLFGKTPPYDYSNTRFYYSGFGDPRLATYYITLRQNF